MYKELFRVKYCNKYYLILSAPDHRKTFLEIKDGKLVYPDINDFLKLHKIFNDKSIVYSIISHDYVEKVNIGNNTYKSVASLLLGLTIGLNIVNPIVESANKQYRNIDVDYENQYRYVLSLYNNREVTREDVIKAINSNDNLNDFQKNTAIEVLDLLLEKDSTVNLRIYYENIKTMTICSFDENDEKLENVEAYYNSIDNSIHMRNLHNRDVLKHELCHSIHHFLYKEDGKEVLLKDSFCGVLEEPMTNFLVDIPELSYSFECSLLRFFWDASDNFTYHDYNEKGIKALADELKQKYKGVDIDYLFDAYDAYHVLLFHCDIKFNGIYEQNDLLDETFKIVISNIDKDNIMDSFNSFISVFNHDDRIVNNYYPQYLKVLLDNNYISQEQYVLLNEILYFDSIAFVNDSFYMANSIDKAYYDHEGNKNNKEDASYLKIGRRNMLENIELLLKYNNCYDKDFMEEFIKSLDLDVAEFKNSVIDLSGRYEELTKIVETMFEIKTSNIADNSKLPEIVSNINNGFNNMRSYTVNTKYFDLLSQNNLLSKDIEDFLNNAQGFTYENDRLVIINNINMPLGVQVLDGKRMNPSVYIMHGNKLNIEDNNGEKQSINGELIYIYEVNSMFKQEFMEKFNPELSLEENINNVLNRNNEIKIYDNRLDIATDFNLEDSMVIEIGRNKANYCYKITNNGKIVNKNCNIFDERTIKIPLTDFITIARNVAINEKLCFDSNTIEEVLFYLKSIYPSINGTISFENAESWHIGIDGKLESIGYTAMKSSIKIIEPKSVSVDNVDYLLNDLFIAKYDNSYYLRLSNTKIIELGTFDNVNNIFIYLESILNNENIHNDTFTLDELVDIANNYLTGEIKQNKTL